MVIHFVKELIESLLTDKFPQSLMTYDLMYYRVRYIGGISIVWQQNDYLIILGTPPAFGSLLSAARYLCDFLRVANYTDRCVQLFRQHLGLQCFCLWCSVLWVHFAL